MKIERISDTQIRCTLSRQDLADRDLKLSELAYGSDKAKDLFRDMMQQANIKFGFEAEDIPLMIEAIPLSGENIILQITKVEYPEELDTRFSKFSEGGEDEEYVVESEKELFSDVQTADEVLETEKSTNEKKDLDINLTKIFEAKKLDQLERLSHILDGYYEGENDIYKDISKNKYYLLVRKSQHSSEEFNKVCNIISEYASGKKYASAKEAFLKEHGKLILKNDALQLLATIER